MGNPAKFYRKLTEDEIKYFVKSGQKYSKAAIEHQNEFFLPSDLYREAEKLGFNVGWKMEKN